MVVVSAMENKRDIKNLDRQGLISYMLSIGETEDRAIRVFQALWQRGIKSFFEIPRLSKKTMKKLDEATYISFLELHNKELSDDGTTKYYWKIASGGIIESVLIPDEDRVEGFADRLTLCVSSQWGCAMRCSFCLTGDLGLQGNLQVSEIANQVLQVGNASPTSL